MVCYNYSIVYYLFGDIFSVDCGIPAFNIPSMPIYDSPCQNKISRYTPDNLPYSIYNSSKQYFSNLNERCDSPQAIFLGSYYPKTYHTMMRDEHGCVNVKIVYCARCHDRIICFKKCYISSCVIFIWIDSTPNLAVIIHRIAFLRKNLCSVLL